MDVIQFFRDFVPAVDIEIVETPLPKMLFGTTLAVPTSTEQRTGNPLFQDLDDLLRIPLSGFADQEMNVLRHDYVPDQPKQVSNPHFVQNADKASAGAGRTEQGTALHTAKGDEVKVALAVAAF